MQCALGGAHSNVYTNACNKDTGLCGSRSASNNAFALAIGGGIEHFGIQLVDADYELTRFGNNFTGGNNSQSKSDSRRLFSFASRRKTGPEPAEELRELALSFTGVGSCCSGPRSSVAYSRRQSSGWPRGLVRRVSWQIAR
jgi:hypothetical protein